MGDGQHLLMYCQWYDSLRNGLHSHFSNKDSSFATLSGHTKIIYLLNLDNNDTC